MAATLGEEYRFSVVAALVMMFSWSRGPSCVHCRATHDIRGLQSGALLGCRRSFDAQAQRFCAHSRAASAVLRGISTPCVVQATQHSKGGLKPDVGLWSGYLTSGRAEADGAGAQIPQLLARLDQALGHVAAAHAEGHLLPHLQGQWYRGPWS